MTTFTAALVAIGTWLIIILVGALLLGFVMAALAVPSWVGLLVGMPLGVFASLVAFKVYDSLDPI